MINIAAGVLVSLATYFLLENGDKQNGQTDRIEKSGDSTKQRADQCERRNPKKRDKNGVEGDKKSDSGTRAETE